VHKKLLSFLYGGILSIRNYEKCQRRIAMLKELIKRFFGGVPIANKQQRRECLFLEAFPMPVFWMDHQKVYQGCNQVFADLMGLSHPSKIIELKDKDFPFPETVLHKRETIFDEVLSGRSSVSILYDCIISLKNEVVWAQKRFAPLHDKSGNIIGILGAVVDISERVNRRKVLELYSENSRVVGDLITDFGATSILSEKSRQLTEKAMLTLKENAAADLIVWANLEGKTPETLLQFCSSELDALELFEKRELLLRKKNQGYLDLIEINVLREIFPETVENIYFYRIITNDLPKMNDVIILVNPDKEKLLCGEIMLRLAHLAVSHYYIHQFLSDFYNQTQPAPPILYHKKKSQLY
jgi:hypothetical protein